MQAYHCLGLYTGLPLPLEELCLSNDISMDQLQQLSAGQYYQAVAVGLANIDWMRILPNKLLLSVRCEA